MLMDNENALYNPNYLKTTTFQTIEKSTNPHTPPPPPPFVLDINLRRGLSSTLKKLFEEDAWDFG